MLHAVSSHEAPGWSAESDGNNILNGDVSGNVNTETIDQQLDHGELGVTYTFDSGMYVGAAIRVIEYDDVNNLLDHDAEILTWRLGMRF